MQVARNFFLTREKTITRKLREVMLAWKIEGSLGKDEILQLYVNQIFLGQRAYGFAAASQIYFGKALKDVTPAEAAMLAGLPKAPSAFNPISNPKRAKSRQLYVLRRMHDLKYITDEEFRDAQDGAAQRPAGIPRSDHDPRGIRRRDGAADRLRRVRRGRLYERPDRRDDDPARRPGSRLCGGAARGFRLRPSARLPRPRGIREPPTERPSARPCSNRCSRT
jgi:membrane peptidoglycan carboxypeptidase